MQGPCSIDSAEGWPTPQRVEGGAPLCRLPPSRDGRQRALLSFAPMMEWSHRYWRYMMRQMTRETVVYTEMVVDSVVRYTDDVAAHLAFSPEEHPIACQLGGSDPDLLAHATEVAVRYGYDEINLNCGCPSNRVARRGCFGAQLMKDPDLVRELCAAMMRRAPRTPVTVKCRLGADDHDTYAHASRFVATVAQSGVRHFIVHARKCHLKGLNPRQNRSVPPLKYDWVFRLARDFPDLDISINGGVATVDDARRLLLQGQPGAGGAAAECMTPAPLWSAMVGRAAWNNPWEWRDVDSRLFGAEDPGLSRGELAVRFAEHCDEWRRRGFQCHPAQVSSPLTSLFRGAPGNQHWRHRLHDNLRPGVELYAPVVAEALRAMPDDLVNAAPAR